MVQQQVDSLAVYGWLLWWLLSQAQNEYFPFLATSSSTTYRGFQKKWLQNAAEAQKNPTKIERYRAGHWCLQKHSGGNFFWGHPAVILSSPRSTTNIITASIFLCDTIYISIVTIWCLSEQKFSRHHLAFLSWCSFLSSSSHEFVIKVKPLPVESHEFIKSVRRQYRSVL